MQLPKRIFFTGVPGSRWSGIAQQLSELEGINNSDWTADREYAHGKFSGHKGAYFGAGMEQEPILDADYIDAAWPEQQGCKIVKSHEWALMLDDVKAKFPNDWIMLVYRPDMSSYAWWFEAGGFNITYPSYTAYKNHAGMLGAIAEQNNGILEFAHKHNLTWNYFNDEWISKTFQQQLKVERSWPDILVTILK